jgi:tetratricopeptide (TPR) repeat protein
VARSAPSVNDAYELELVHDATSAAAATLRGAEWYHRAGRLADARTSFAAALEVSRAAADDELFGRAALGLGGVWVHEHRDVVERTHVVAFQREACNQLDDRSPLAVRLQTRVAAEASYMSGDPSAMRAVVERARVTGDRLALADALSLAHHCLLGPDHAVERRALADELIEVSATTGRALDASMGLLWQTIDLYLAGDARADRSLEQLRARDLESCVHYVVVALGVMQATRNGDLERAEQLANECYDVGVEVGDADALSWFGAQLVLLRWLQGRGAELLPYLNDLSESPTLAETNDGFDAAIAALAAAAGRVDEARAALQRLRARGLAALRNSSAWLVKMQGVVEAAYILGDAGVAREAYALLAPYAALPAMASLAVACFGSVHRALGIAASTFGDLDLAITHLERAIDAELALGNRPCHAISTAYLAETLQRRGDAGSRTRILALRRSATNTARECGMTVRAQEWAAALDRFGTVECRRDGQDWQFSVDGRSVRVPDSVGMRYLARLVEMPGVEIGAVDLASPDGATPVRARQALIDDRALAAYRRRAGELQVEIDEAEDHCDLERAARARAEFDALVEEVERATGLLGRSRTFVDEVERARTSVQKAIKRALARITSTDPAIGETLAERIVTGTRCAYLPRAACPV